MDAWKQLSQTRHRAYRNNFDRERYQKVKTIKIQPKALVWTVAHTGELIVSGLPGLIHNPTPTSVYCSSIALVLL